MEKGIKHYTSKHSKYELTVNIGELKPGKILENRVIMITGATRGIGYAIAEKCISQGAKVIITGRSEDSLKKCKEKLGVNCECILLDICDIKLFEQALEAADSFFGTIDSLVNNAGVSLHEGNFMNVNEETWDTQLNTNLKGPFFLTQAWIRYYERKGLKSGKIIMMASDTSGMGSSIPYGISKAGITSFTRGLAKHVIKKGIRINAIAPGTTKTEMTEDFTKGEIVRETTEGKRVIFPEEISEVCLFLLSDASACMSGNIFGCTEANICFDNSTTFQIVEAETNP